MAEVNDLVVRGSATVSSMKVVGNTNLLGNTNLEGEATVGSMKVVGNTNLEGETTVEGNIKFQPVSTEGNLFPDNTDTVKYLMNWVYPVGSYFITHNSGFGSAEDVKNYFGGAWEQVTSGHFLEACSSGAGSQVEAGLPNIKGSFAIAGFQGSSVNFPVWGENKGNTTKLFVNGDTGPTSMTIASVKTSGDLYYRLLTFDASRVDSTYNDDIETVQPQARRVYIYYRTGLYNG